MAQATALGDTTGTVAIVHPKSLYAIQEWIQAKLQIKPKKASKKGAIWIFMFKQSI